MKIAAAIAAQLSAHNDGTQFQTACNSRGRFGAPGTLSATWVWSWVYARIHVVEDAGELIGLGSDCFAKRYGEGHAKGFQGRGAGGGRMLTQAEREMLLHSTAALLAQFEFERRKEQELVEAKLAALPELHTLRSQHSGTQTAPTQRSRGTLRRARAKQRPTGRESENAHLLCNSDSGWTLPTSAQGVLSDSNSQH